MVEMIKRIRTGGKVFEIGNIYSLNDSIEKKWIKRGWAKKTVKKSK
jgi:hypothetical protein